MPRLRRLFWAALGLLGLLAASLAWPLPDDVLETGGVVSLRITDRHGTLLREVHPDGRGQPVALADVPDVLVQALLATEDRRYYRHPGIDPLAVGRAVVTNLRAGAVVSGASTLTMQVARALHEAPSRSWTAKLAEAHLALRLEARLSKDAILTLWLNRVPFGPRTYGIEAAAQRYFGKSARDLTAAEATFLVGLPQSPSRYDPFRHLERARGRHARVLGALVRTGQLTEGERTELLARPLTLVRPDAAFRAPHFVDALLREASWPADAAEVRTTLDAELQATVEGLARGHLQRLGAEEVGNAAVLVLENATGAVRAYVGSVDYWDERAGGQNDGVRMRRQPGSALKPFTYALALTSRRYTPATILPDIETPVVEAGGAFSPANYDERYHGPVPLRQALACSYNVPAVRVARALTPAALLQTLHAHGFASLTRPAEHYGVGLTLGNGEVQLAELAQAYAGLARGGARPSLASIAWVRTAGGDTLAAPPPVFTESGLEPAVAHLITDILSDPEARAPAFGRGGPLELPFPMAVKTGTSKDYRDNWAIGTTPTYTVAVWAGNFDGSPMRWVSGVTGAGALLNAIARHLGSGGAFTRPAGVVDAVVCPASGLRPGAHCPTRRTEPFLAGTVPADTCGVHRLVRLDARTGLLADAATPREAVRTELFTVHPPLFHPWMRAHGWPLPPTATEAAASAHDAAPRTTDNLQIQLPEHGTVYRLDPVLRADYQQLHLRGTVPPEVLDVRWWVDGEPLPGDYRTASWPLQPGRHTIELRARTPDGAPLRSRPSVIRVE